MRKTNVASISLPPKVEKELSRAAKQYGKSRSEIVREALRYYFTHEKFSALQRELSLRAKMLGITDEDKVEELIDSIRS